MGWQNVIIGYRLKSFEKNDVIPVDAKFITTISGSVYFGGRNNSYTDFIYQIPIYKKKNIKK